MHGAHSSAGEGIRPHTRYTLATTVEIRAASLRGTVLAQLDNISLSGCYVHTPTKPGGAHAGTRDRADRLVQS